MQFYLGVDGGGSKTRALLVDRSGRIIHQLISGPSNLNLSSSSTVQSTLEALIHSCAEKADIKQTTACFGIAGASNQANKETLRSIIERTGIKNFDVETDAEIALAGAFLGKPGILLIAGTGSVCFAKTPRGKIIKTGGWGWLADDTGSASWIGQKAIESALKQQDGRSPDSTFRNSIFEALLIESEDQIVERLYSPTLTRAQLGQLAPIVANLAQSGDPAAQAIISAALDDLELLARTTAKKASDKALPVAFYGGLLEHLPSLRQSLAQRIGDFDIQEPKLPAAAGAALTVYQAAHGQIDPNWISQLKESLREFSEDETPPL